MRLLCCTAVACSRVISSPCLSRASKAPPPGGGVTPNPSNPSNLQRGVQLSESRLSKQTQQACFPNNGTEPFIKHETCFVPPCAATRRRIARCWTWTAPAPGRWCWRGTGTGCLCRGCTPGTSAGTCRSSRWMGTARMRTCISTASVTCRSLCRSVFSFCLRVSGWKKPAEPFVLFFYSRQSLIFVFPPSIVCVFFGADSDDSFFFLYILQELTSHHSLTSFPILHTLLYRYICIRAAAFSFSCHPQTPASPSLSNVRLTGEKTSFSTHTHKNKKR